MKSFNYNIAKLLLFIPDILGVLLKNSCSLISVYVEYLGEEWSSPTQNLEKNTWHNVEISTTVF